jgi:hypothetical protein
MLSSIRPGSHDEAPEAAMDNEQQGKLTSAHVCLIMVSLGVSRAFTRALAFWRRASRAWLSPPAREVPKEPISVDKPGTLFMSVAVRATDISTVVSPLSMLPMVKLMEYPVNEYADASNLWFFWEVEGVLDRTLVDFHRATSRYHLYGRLKGAVATWELNHPGPGLIKGSSGTLSTSPLPSPPRFIMYTHV